MTGFDLKFRAFQKLFLNADKVQRKLYSRSKLAMSRIGANLRRTARTSIKRRGVTQGQRQRLAAARASGDKSRAARLLASINKKRSAVSAPGSPPFAHVADHPVASIRAIYFAAFQDRVIVGPVKADRGLAGGKTIPELMEFGGSVPIRNSKTGRRRQARYRPRPFMSRALEKEKNNTTKILAAVWSRAA